MNTKNRRVRPIAELLCFIITAAVLLIFLLASALIPRGSIYDNMLSSAEYLCEGELFGDALEGIKGSRIDRYADSILLGIAWQYDAGHPLSSVMRSAYYYTPLQNENENLREALLEEKEANRQYLRYWHGSITVVRPLLTIFTLKEIYAFNAAVMVVLLIAYIVIMIKNRAYVPLAGMLAALVLTQVWFVPLSLEYTWTVMLMLIFAIAAFILAKAGKSSLYGCLFVIAGVTTNYFDFLTTETLTLTVPLLLIMWVEAKKVDSKKLWPLVIRSALCWGLSYVLMWLLKWGLAGAVLGENPLPYITEHVEERLGGGIGLNLWDYLWGAIFRNVSCLFPLEYGTTGKLTAIALVIGYLYLISVYRKSTFDKKIIMIYGAAALLPYVRYLVLHNHSFIHCFFTYRAQIATVMALAFIAGEMVDGKLLQRKKV
ncbi:MAG: hypothetical protein J6X66_01595 [Lachnospiraceae bacterium]|nr:hypothetical protein [Lachnospiraceae bacterium]